MIEALDEADAPEDVDNVTESSSSSPASARTSIIHTKLGSPKPVVTLEGFMQVPTGPGNPLPRTFQGKLETFLNTSHAVDRPSREEYLKV